MQHGIKIYNICRMWPPYCLARQTHVYTSLRGVQISASLVLQPQLFGLYLIGVWVYSQTRQQLMLGSFLTALSGALGCTDSGSMLSPISCLLPSVNCRLHNLATILKGLIQLLMTQLTALADGRAGNPPPCLGIPLPPGAACMILHSPQLLLLIRLLKNLAGRRVLFLRACARGCRAQYGTTNLTLF
jgi:hypothetical protein